MGLSIQKFLQTEPFMPYRFEVRFFGNLDNNEDISLNNMTYYVRSVKYPTISEGEGDNTIYLGNGILKIPVFNPASRELEISFEETDILALTRLVDIFLNYQRLGMFKHIIVAVNEFERDMSSIKSSRAFHCRLKSYDEPSFSNGGGVQLATTNIVFKVDNEIEWNGTDLSLKKDISGQYGGTKSSDIKSVLLNEISFIEEKQNKEKQQQENNKEKIQEQNKENSQQQQAPAENKTNTKNKNKEVDNSDPKDHKDFKISDSEIDANLAKTNKNTGLKIDREKFKEVTLENAARMETAFNELQKRLAEKGIKVVINTYNDTGHGVGTNSLTAKSGGTHLFGQKIDLTFLNENGQKIYTENMSKEELDTILESAKASGLTPNWESDPKKNGKESFWGDFALSNALSFDSKGNIVERELSSWTGETSFYNQTEKKNRNKIQTV